jgi:hypothetical protein
MDASALPITCPCFRTVDDLFRPSERVLIDNGVMQRMGSLSRLCIDENGRYRSASRGKNGEEDCVVVCTCWEGLRNVEFYILNGKRVQADMHVMLRHEVGHDIPCKCIVYPLGCDYQKHDATYVKRWWQVWKGLWNAKDITTLRIRMWILLKRLRVHYPSLCKDIRVLLHRRIFAIKHL